MASPATIQGRSCGAFQHRDRFNIIGIDGRDRVAEIEARSKFIIAGSAVVGIVHGHAVYHIQWLVVACDIGITSYQYFGRTARTSGGIADDESRYPAGEGIDHVGITGPYRWTRPSLPYGITQCLFFSFDTGEVTTTSLRFFAEELRVTTAGWPRDGTCIILSSYPMQVNIRRLCTCAGISKLPSLSETTVIFNRWLLMLTRGNGSPVSLTTFSFEYGIDLITSCTNSLYRYGVVL